MKNESNTIAGDKRMPKSFPLLILLMIFFGLSICGIAQQVSPKVICSAGERFVTSSQSIQFALGEIAVETYQTGNNLLSQGFIQGSKHGTGIKEDMTSIGQILIYPNPSRGQLTVSCKNDPVKIAILDLQGRTLSQTQNPAKSSTLTIEDLQNGMYLLKITFKNKISATRRIIKN